MAEANRLEKLISERERVREIKKNNLLALWRDPELAGIVEVLKNGHLGSPTEQQEPTKAVPAKRPSGSIRQAIIGLAESLPKQFTARNILETLQHNGYRFKASDRIGAVRDALLALGKDGEVRIVQKAAGESPNVFEWVKP